jgi:predicted AlkP superfamily pyrophosphatase or phosphodiesterase
VSNTISDPAMPERFSMSADTARDPRWWQGEPLWLTVMRQGGRAASMFWPGSEAIGRQPTYWRPFDDTLPDNVRVDQVLEWLALPAERRPSFITLYFSAVDTAGHDFGPRSREVERAAAQIDAAIGRLLDGMQRLNLRDQITMVVVSDHGMSEVSDERVIFLDDYADLSGFDVVEWSPNLAVRPRGGSLDTLEQSLRNRHPALSIFTRNEMPATLFYRDSPRIAPLIGLAADGWTLTTRERFRPSPGPRGDHGYNPGYASMHGLFVAAGPRIREGVTAPRFESVHVYAFLCELLGITAAPNDGDLSVTRGLIK